MTDCIRLLDLTFDCVVGILPDERDREQPVFFDIGLELDLSSAGRTGKISDTVDYDRVARIVEALVRFRRYRLIEAAAEETAAMLLSVYPEVDAVGIDLRKPGALANARSASVSISRRRGDHARRFEDTKWGRAEVVLETREAGLYLLHVDEGREIPLHHHRIMREIEWLVAGELWSERGAVDPFSPVIHEHGELHSYYNRSREKATLFCCDCPPFIPQDEIEEEVRR